MDRKVLIGVGVAAAATAAAVGGVAYWLAKEESFTANTVSSRPVAIEVKIRRCDCGLVIGKRGETIREIQQRTQTRIHFKDERETETERVLVIHGNPQQAQLAEILIHQTIGNQPKLETLVLNVPGYSVGFIIGTRGDTIRDIQFTSQCKIEVEKSSGDAFSLFFCCSILRTIDFFLFLGDGPRQITLKGTAEQLSFAKQLIDAKVLLARERMTESQPEPEARIAKKPPPLLSLTAENELSVPPPSDQRQEQIWPSNCDPDKTSIQEVYVSSICDPGKFYVQKVGPESVELDKLAQDMSSFYDVMANRELHIVSDVEEGDVVAARFSSDNVWYRAKVVDILPDEYDSSKTEVDVDFLDYGDFERMPVTEICCLKQDYLKLKFQAVECTLAHVKPSR